MNKILPTTVVGSYPQPGWLIDRDKLGSKVPRLRAPEIWRVEAALLEEAQDDATLLAIRDMERAGIDIITDGEMRRESYSNRFATSLDGVDLRNPGTTINRTGARAMVPRIRGPIVRSRPIEVRDVQFLRANTDRTIKITLPGPFTMAQQAQDDYYRDEEALALAYADAVNAEARDLKAAGADLIQLDEPWLQARPERAAAAVHDKPSGYSFLPQLADTSAAQISIEAAQPRLDLGVLKDLAPKTVVLGVIDLGTEKVESAEEVARRIRAALEHVPPERLVAAPDCGMKYLSRAAAFGKLQALVRGASLVRGELA